MAPESVINSSLLSRQSSGSPNAANDDDNDLYMAPETVISPCTSSMKQPAAKVKSKDPVILPSGWIRVFDETHQQHYYFNRDTRETKWVLPS